MGVQVGEGHGGPGDVTASFMDPQNEPKLLATGASP